GGLKLCEQVWRVAADIRAHAGRVAAGLHEEMRALAGTTLLPAGGGGSLGGFVLDVLAAWTREGGDRPCRVIALDNFRTGLPERVRHLEGDPQIEFVAHDVSRPLAEAPAVDWIIHAASIASPTFYRRFPPPATTP